MQVADHRGLPSASRFRWITEFSIGSRRRPRASVVAPLCSHQLPYTSEKMTGFYLRPRASSLILLCSLVATSISSSRLRFLCIRQSAVQQKPKTKLLRMYLMNSGKRNQIAVALLLAEDLSWPLLR